MIKAETKRIMRIHDDKSVYLSDEDILSYVQNVKVILETFDIHDRELINDLLTLLEKVSVKGQAISEARDIKRRRKRQTETSNETTDKLDPVAETAIGLLNLIQHDRDPSYVIKLSTDKLKWLCREQDKEYGELEIIRIKSGKDFRKEEIKIPKRGLTGSAFIKLNALYDIDYVNEYCIGTMYNQSFLNAIYQLNVYARKQNGTDENFELVPSKIDGTNAEQVQITVHLNNSLKVEEVECEMFVDEKWDSTVCLKIVDDQIQEKGNLKCNCTRNAPFHIVKVIQQPSYSIAITEERTTVFGENYVSTVFESELSTIVTTEISVNGSANLLREGDSGGYCE